MEQAIKNIDFYGSALDDLRNFPASARREAGVQLDRVQRGLDPDDWRPMSTVGAGVREIRVRDVAGAFRVMYVANLGDVIVVLHCFQKKTQQTSKKDIDLAGSRYKAVIKEMGR
jgi:phage-related protein